MLARLSGCVAGLILILSVFIAMLTGCAIGPEHLILEPVRLDAGVDNRTKASIEKELGIFNDPRLIPYLNSLARKLTGSDPNSGENIRIVIYDRYTPNIFAVPGITIYISRGMLALLQNEDELAQILAHQIAHVNLKHSNRQMAPYTGLSFLRINGDLVDRVISRDVEPLIDIPLNKLIRGYMASHSPRDEFEADTYGRLLAADSGFDPAALPAVLYRLQMADIRVPGEFHIPGFFDTHVSEFHRIGRLRDESDEIKWGRKPGRKPDSDIFLKKLDGLMLGPNPERGVVEGNQFFHPVLDMAIKIPFGWSTATTGRAAVTVSPNENATMVLSFEGENTGPEQAAKIYIRALEEALDVNPVESIPVKIGGQHAYLATYKDSSGDEPACLVFLWIAYRGQTYRLFGLGPERRKPILKNTAFSFRSMSAEVRASLTEKRLKLVSARADESVVQLSKRTDNAWDSGTTAKMNGLGYERPLYAGQLVKIAVSKTLR